MMRQLVSVLVLSILFMGTGVFAAEQQEEIKSFDTYIVVNVDASIDVTEVITVYASGKVIKRGIVRDLPTQYVDSYGIKRNTRYQIKNILKNGVNSNYHVRNTSYQKSIYIGDEHVYLSPDIYTYTISYHVNNAVNFLKDADEIYWNITGNNWPFPILKSTALINLPSGAVIHYSTAYTGSKGEKGRQFQQNKVSNNQIQFTTTTPLTSGQGLTVAVAWQKGIVIQPSFWQSHKIDYCVFAMVLLVLIYYSLIWYSEGRDLRNKSIIPLFEPPDNLSPEAMRYIINMDADFKIYACAIVSMAAKGYLTIKNESDELTLIKNIEFTGSLPEEESAIAEQLFVTGSIKLSNVNAGVLNKARDRLLETLKKLYANTCFRTNSKYVFYGVLLSLLAGAVPLMSQSIDPVSKVVYIFCIIYIFTFQVLWIVSVILFFTSIYNILVSQEKVKYFLCVLFLLAFLVPLSIFEIVILVYLTSAISLFSIMCLSVIPFVNLAFNRLMKAPTPLGRNVMDQIDGFRMYLSTAERYRLKNAVLPEKTPQLFEKYLPYAMALDVENEWGAQFDDVLLQAGIDPATYHPSWYVGRVAWDAHSLSNMTSTLSGSLTSSISSSSSASSGRGSSGGGRGGGGGGGW